MQNFIGRDADRDRCLEEMEADLVAQHVRGLAPVVRFLTTARSAEDESLQHIASSDSQPSRAYPHSDLTYHGCCGVFWGAFTQWTPLPCNCRSLDVLNLLLECALGGCPLHGPLE